MRDVEYLDEIINMQLNSIEEDIKTLDEEMDKLMELLYA